MGLSNARLSPLPCVIAYYQIGITRFTVSVRPRLRRIIFIAHSPISLVSTVYMPEPGYSSEKLLSLGPTLPECSAVTK